MSRNSRGNQNLEVLSVISRQNRRQARSSGRKKTDSASSALTFTDRRASLRRCAASAGSKRAVAPRKRADPHNQQRSSTDPVWPILDHIPTVGETVGLCTRIGSAPTRGVVTAVRARIKIVDVTIGRTSYRDVGFAKLVDISSDENGGAAARKRGKPTTPRAAQTPVAADDVPAAQRAVVTTTRLSATASSALMTLRAAQARSVAENGSRAVSFAAPAAVPNDPSSVALCRISNPFDRTFKMQTATDRLVNIAELVNSLRSQLVSGAVVTTSDARKLRAIADALPPITATLLQGARRGAPNANASVYAHQRLSRADRESRAEAQSALVTLEAHNAAASASSTRGGAATSASSTRGGGRRAAASASSTRGGGHQKKRRKKRRSAVAKSRKIVLSSTVTVTLRDPDDGSKYTPTEVVSYFASPLPRGSMKKIFASMSKLGLVAVEERALYKVVAKANAGQPVPASFNRSGRPPLTAVAAIQSFASTQTASGNTLNAPQMKAHLMKLRRETLERAGFAPTEKQCTPSDTTVTNYLAVAGTHNNMRVQQLTHVHDKTRRRYIAEHSIRGALSWLYTMAHTHFIIGVAPPGRARPNDQLVKLIENAVGVPVYPLLPDLILNVDDTTLFAGSTNTKKDFTWVLVNAEHTGKVRSPFSTDGVAFQRGCRRAFIESYCFVCCSEVINPLFAFH